MFRLAVAAFSVAFAATIAGASAAPADRQQWGFVADRADAILFYGVPESHDLKLNVICEPKRKRIGLVSFVLPPKPRVGAVLRISLTNDGARLGYDGKIGRDRTHDISFVEARVGFDRKLFDFLATGRTLMVEAGGARETIPLAGISKPLAMMTRACLDSRLTRAARL
jgi:hypothetical protein